MRALAPFLELLLPPACLACGGWMGPSPSASGSAAPRRQLCGTCASRVRTPEPPTCPRCAAPLGEARPDGPCPGCHDWPPALGLVRSAATLAPPADDLVHALKYGGWPEAAAEMARCLRPVFARLVRELGTEPGQVVLVPVPTTPARARRRGYNQARVLADALVECATTTPAPGAGPRVTEMLVRTRESGSQVALHREERMANVSGAFHVRPGALSGLPRTPVVVLVDDVLTTGATASAAATVLAEAGAGTVHLLTYARALPGRQGHDEVVLPPPGFFQNWLRAGGRSRRGG
jgi:predicted amidophosphoribosyltransferase